MDKIGISLITYQVPQTQAFQYPDGTVSDNLVQLVNPCRSRVQIGEGIYDFTIYPPFPFEASIPWGLGWLLGHKCSNKNLVYACPHDAGYLTHILPKELLDRLLDQIAERVGKSGFISTLTYRGVKYFGGRAWSKGGKLSPEDIAKICTLVEVTTEVSSEEVSKINMQETTDEKVDVRSDDGAGSDYADGVFQSV